MSTDDSYFCCSCVKTSCAPRTKRTLRHAAMEMPQCSSVCYSLYSRLHQPKSNPLVANQYIYIYIYTDGRDLARQAPGEQMTAGLDGYLKRAAKYYKAGCRFCKWRNVYKIQNGTVSESAVRFNAETLARYAVLSQMSGLVPIVEPEVMIDGKHDIETSQRVSEHVWAEVVNALQRHGVIWEGCLLKPNMVVPGAESGRVASPEEAAHYTVLTLGRTMPAALPGVTFLSGGLSEVQASEYLNAMNRCSLPRPWNLSFSYARALQSSALKAWGAGRRAFMHRAKMNSLAQLGKYERAQDDASSQSLYVAGNSGPAIATSITIHGKAGQHAQAPAEIFLFFCSFVLTTVSCGGQGSRCLEKREPLEGAVGTLECCLTVRVPMTGVPPAEQWLACLLYPASLSLFFLLFFPSSCLPFFHHHGPRRSSQEPAPAYNRIKTPYEAELVATVKKMTARGKGLLAADESIGSCSKRFDPIGLSNTEEHRRQYRALMLDGVILHDETVGQRAANGQTFPEFLTSKGVVPGIKTDGGLCDLLEGAPGEQMTAGLDGYLKRAAKYYKAGCRFCKWRNVYKIQNGTVSESAVRFNAETLARYAVLSQMSGLVPIVEPEVMIDGKHDIETSQRVSEHVWAEVVNALQRHGVIWEGCLLKPNMVVPGAESGRVASPEEAAHYTVLTLGRTMPAALPGVTFLSGGLSEVQASEYLNAMNRCSLPRPWNLSFSYARALQSSALKAWGGKASGVEAGRRAFMHRAKMNSLAQLGKYERAQDDASSQSLYVAGNSGPAIATSITIHGKAGQHAQAPAEIFLFFCSFVLTTVSCGGQGSRCLEKKARTAGRCSWHPRVLFDSPRADDGSSSCRTVAGVLVVSCFSLSILSAFLPFLLPTCTPVHDNNTARTHRLPRILSFFHHHGPRRSSQEPAPAYNRIKTPYEAELVATVKKMTARGKGLLAADESIGSCSKRFDPIGLSNTEEHRRQYRALMLDGVILHDETVGQRAANGQTFPEFLTSKGVVPGIKTDGGLCDLLEGAPGEQMTAGLDGYLKRAAKYYKAGCRFCKWRNVYKIQNGTVSESAVRFNAETLARYAVLSQMSGLVPIVEPEVMIDGKHDIETSQRVSEHVWAEVVNALQRHGVIWEGCLLKPNMVVPGAESGRVASPEEAAHYTVLTLGRTMPAALPGVTFLSGGLSEVQASEYLNAMNRCSLPRPWNLSFSYARALQSSALKAWGGKASGVEAGRRAFMHRAKMNSLAQLGKYERAQDDASSQSLYVAGNSY
eukprot:gene5027-3621_t